MRRRDFVIASASAIATTVPFISRAAPCPPSPVSVAGGGSAATTCGQNGSGTYTTNFDLTENPISEGGKWVQQGELTGLDWKNVRTAGGIAFATGVNLSYDDSIALLGGFTPNHRISGVIHFAGSRSNNTSTHEVELILRGSYTPHVQHLYECNLGYSGATGWYAQIMRMDGAAGAFTNIDTISDPINDIRDGDLFMAEVVGNRIRSYLNGTLIREAVDSSYPTGQPGIGFFWRGTENVNDFALTSITASNI